MRISTIIATHNRCRTLLRTLERLRDIAGPQGSEEIWVIDNASTDRTVKKVSRQFPDVHLLRNRSNDGPCARNDVLDAARGDYLVLLDDDSYPVDNAAVVAAAYLDTHPRTAVVGGRVVRHDGSPESSAYPTVPVGCGMCVRASVMKQVGGFCRRFIRRAETFDLALRILDAGHLIEQFSDIEYRHDPPAGGRMTAVAHRLDMRNHLSLLNRLVPDPLRRRISEDWIQRYTALATADGHRGAAMQGLAEADRWAVSEDLFNAKPVQPQTIETVFQFKTQTEQVARWTAQNRVRRVCIADYGRNIFATYCACIASKLDVVAIAENADGFRGLRYRDIPVEPDATALAGAEGVILSNLNRARVSQRMAQLRHCFDGPILEFGQPLLMSDGSPAREDEAFERPLAGLLPTVPSRAMSA